MCYALLEKCLLLCKTCYNYTINPLKPKLIQIIFKNSVRTSKRTQSVTITNTNLLKLFKEIIAAYVEKNTEPISTKRRVTDC
jgi:hypothetical protein